MNSLLLFAVFGIQLVNNRKLVSLITLAAVSKTVITIHISTPRGLGTCYQHLICQRKFLASRFSRPYIIFSKRLVCGWWVWKRLIDQIIYQNHTNWQASKVMSSNVVRFYTVLQRGMSWGYRQIIQKDIKATGRYISLGKHRIMYSMKTIWKQTDQGGNLF